MRGDENLVAVETELGLIAVELEQHADDVVDGAHLAVAEHLLVFRGESLGGAADVAPIGEAFAGLGGQVDIPCSHSQEDVVSLDHGVDLVCRLSLTLISQ